MLCCAQNGYLQSHLKVAAHRGELAYLPDLQKRHIACNTKAARPRPASLALSPLLLLISSLLSLKLTGDLDAGGLIWMTCCKGLKPGIYSALPTAQLRGTCCESSSLLRALLLT